MISPASQVSVPRCWPGVGAETGSKTYSETGLGRKWPSLAEYEQGRPTNTVAFPTLGGKLFAAPVSDSTFLLSKYDEAFSARALLILGGYINGSYEGETSLKRRSS